MSQFSVDSSDSASLRRMPADVADVANGPRPDLQDVVSCLLVAMRAATMNATSPVVWPGCTVAAPASSAF
ncbi:unnamed protein product [Ectocarpus sp. CCAP 1310/34]|nr:unnamed protein product [Ectocarpus sp. CCAP 1310/34]